MAVRCLNCGYEMSTWQELCSAVGKILGPNSGTGLEWARSYLLAGFLNTGPDSEKVGCPKCGIKGRWEDI